MLPGQIFTNSLFEMDKEKVISKKVYDQKLKEEVYEITIRRLPRVERIKKYGY